MQAFGWAEGKMQGVGAHDDTVMAMWMADRAVVIGGSFSGFDDEAPKANMTPFNVWGGDDKSAPVPGGLPDGQRDVLGLGVLEDEFDPNEADRQALWGPIVGWS
jgi:hypothetical protein